MGEHKYSDREDGLAHCMVCNGGEGSLPTECPGTKMSMETQDAVYAGRCDFIGGKWIDKRPCDPNPGDIL